MNKFYSCSNFSASFVANGVNYSDVLKWSFSTSERNATIKMTLSTYATGFESIGKADVILPISDNPIPSVIKEVKRQNGLVSVSFIPEIVYKINDGNVGSRWMDLSSYTTFQEIVDAYFNELGISYETEGGEPPDLDIIKDWLNFHTISNTTAMLNFFAGIWGLGWYIDIFQNKIIFTSFDNIQETTETIDGTPIRNLTSNPQKYFSKIQLLYAPTKTEVEFDLNDGSGAEISIEVPYPIQNFNTNSFLSWVKKMRIGYYRKQHVYHYNEIYDKVKNLFMKKYTDPVTLETLLVVGIDVTVDAPNCFITIEGYLLQD